MPEGPFKMGREPLHTEARVGVFQEGLQNNDLEKTEIMTLKLGNSGLRLVCTSESWLDKKDGHLSWKMHFTPESNTKPKIENRVQYSRMFAAGFVSMIETLALEETSVHPELSKALAQYPPVRVGFNTNDTMWNFVCNLIGEKYFVKIPQDFSKIETTLHEPIRRLLDEKGWPGDFLLADFLIDYSADPSILNRCIKLADIKKLQNLKVKNKRI